jgi:hypothetical protein
VCGFILVLPEAFSEIKSGLAPVEMRPTAVFGHLGIFVLLLAKMMLFLFLICKWAEFCAVWIIGC